MLESGGDQIPSTSNPQASTTDPTRLNFRGRTAQVNGLPRISTISAPAPADRLRVPSSIDIAQRTTRSQSPGVTGPLDSAAGVSDDDDGVEDIDMDEEDLDFWGRASPHGRNVEAGLEHQSSIDDQESSDEEEDVNEDDDDNENMGDDMDDDEEDGMEIFGHR